MTPLYFALEMMCLISKLNVNELALWMAHKKRENQKITATTSVLSTILMIRNKKINEYFNSFHNKIQKNGNIKVLLLRIIMVKDTHTQHIKINKRIYD